jgi:uncharacterized protein
MGEYMIVGIYAGILALIQVALSAQVILQRMKFKVLLGDGGEKDLQRQIRIHGNFIETVPIILILLLILDLNYVDEWIIHTLGIGLVAARLLHAYGAHGGMETEKVRRAGMVLTLSVMLVAGVLNIASF